MRKNTVKKILLFFMVMVMCFTWPSYSYALSTQEKLDQAEKDREETKQDIADAENKQNSLISKQTTLKGTLDALNQELTEVCENLAVIETDIAVKEDEIDTFA